MYMYTYHVKMYSTMYIVSLSMHLVVTLIDIHVLYTVTV